MSEPLRLPTPIIDPDAFIAPNATIHGDVTIGAAAVIMFGVVLRAELDRISVGARTNIQDLTVIHVNEGTHPTTVEDAVTVGHRAIIHGCHVKSGALIGMGKRNARLNTAALKVARAIGPIHFGADGSSTEPLNVVKHLTSDYIKKKLAV